jgi:hypothetical protein
VVALLYNPLYLVWKKGRLVRDRHAMGKLSEIILRRAIQQQVDPVIEQPRIDTGTMICRKDKDDVRLVCQLMKGFLIRR